MGYRQPKADAMIAIVLAAGGLLFWLSYALRAGFLYDDLSIVANYTYGLHEQVSFRPGFLLWAPIQVHLFGFNPLPYYLVAHVLFAGAAAMVFVALRSLDVPRAFAIFAAAFVVLAPDADGAHLWWTGLENVLSAGLVLLSVAIGTLWTLRRRSWAWLLVSEGSLLVGAGIYELSTTILLLPLCLVWHVRGGRRVFVKIALDIGVAAIAVAATYMENRAAGIQQIRPFNQVGVRAVSIFNAGLTMIQHRVAGLGAARPITLPFAALVGVLAFAALHVLGRRAGFARPSTARGMPVLVAAVLAGLGVFVAWVPLVPANDWYLPTLLGVGSRVNSTAVVFAGISVAMMLWFAASAGRWLRSSRRVMATAAATSLLVAFAQAALADADVFVRAAAQREAIILSVRQLSPHLSPNSLVLLSDYNTYRGPSWVPLLAADWDTSGALRLAYRDASVGGVPLLDAHPCGADGVMALGRSTPYERVTAIDVDRGLLVPLHNRQNCLAAAQRPARPYPA